MQADPVEELPDNNGVPPSLQNPSVEVRVKDEQEDDNDDEDDDDTEDDSGHESEHKELGQERNQSAAQQKQ